MTLVMLLFFCSTLYLTRCDVMETVPKVFTAESINDTITSDVTETQHATCKIATDALVADARATVTRVLTGACNAKRIDERFDNLEKNLTRELEDIKALLHTILENRKDVHAHTNIAERATRIENINYKRINDHLSPRKEEMRRLNNTIQEYSRGNGSGRMFVYYWQVNDFNEKLSSWNTGQSERSSTFYVGQGGYAMYIKLTPKYFPDGTVFIAVGLTRGRYDSLLKWPFPHKIRVEVLDNSTEDTKKDRRSRIWDPSTLCSEYFWGRPKSPGEPDNPECVGLSVPRDVLGKYSRYIWNGSFTIKLVIFL